MISLSLYTPAKVVPSEPHQPSSHVQCTKWLAFNPIPSQELLSLDHKLTGNQILFLKWQCIKTIVLEELKEIGFKMFKNRMWNLGKISEIHDTNLITLSIFRLCREIQHVVECFVSVGKAGGHRGWVDQVGVLKLH